MPNNPSGPSLSDLLAEWLTQQNFNELINPIRTFSSATRIVNIIPFPNGTEINKTVMITRPKRWWEFWLNGDHISYDYEKFTVDPSSPTYFQDLEKWLKT